MYGIRLTGAAFRPDRQRKACISDVLPLVDLKKYVAIKIGLKDMYKTRNLPNTRIDVADALRGIAVAGI